MTSPLSGGPKWKRSLRDVIQREKEEAKRLVQLHGHANTAATKDLIAGMQQVNNQNIAELYEMLLEYSE